MKNRYRYIGFFVSVGFAGVFMLLLTSGRAQTPTELREWGEQTLDQIRKDYAIPGSGLYADAWKANQARPGGPAFMWGCGVMLPALVAGAANDPDKYSDALKSYVKALDVYLTDGPNGLPGYDVLPMPKPFDRYYDDNMWVDLALVEAYEVTGERDYLKRAETIMQFILSGEDTRLGGGIYWKEKEKTSKNTCSNGPAIACAARLYQVTHKASYLTTAERLYDWTKSHLQDADGLYWDNVKLDGKIEKTKWSYNTALMIRSSCLLYQATHKPTYLEEAKRVAAAAEAYWFRKDTGAIADGGQFAHLLCEAMVAVSQIDHDSKRLDSVKLALRFVHDNIRDSNGHFGDQWNVPITKPLDKAGVLSQASVARAFLFAAKNIR